MVSVRFAGRLLPPRGGHVMRCTPAQPIEPGVVWPPPTTRLFPQGRRGVRSAGTVRRRGGRLRIVKQPLGWVKRDENRVPATASVRCNRRRDERSRSGQRRSYAERRGFRAGEQRKVAFLPSAVQRGGGSGAMPLAFTPRSSPGGDEPQIETDAGRRSAGASSVHSVTIPSGVQR